MKRSSKLRILGISNFFIFQFLFIRFFLAYDLLDPRKAKGIGFLFPVLPFSGWSFIPSNPKSFTIFNFKEDL